MTARFRFGDALLHVSCQQGNLLAWIDSYLGPFFPLTATGVPARDWTLRVFSKRTDVARAAKTFALGANGIVQESESGSSWFSSEPNQWFVKQADLETGGPTSYFSLNPARRLVDLAVWGDHLEAPYILGRLCRSILMSEACGQGWVPIHGACFILRGRGVLVLGPKGAGKTTFLCTAAKKLSASFVSNDRVLLRSDGVRAHGLPHSAGVRRDLLRRLDLPMASDYYWQEGSGEKIRFLVTDLCGRLGCNINSECEISVALFPKYRPGPLRITPLSSAQVRERLQKNQLRTLCEYLPLWDQLAPQPLLGVPTLTRALEVEYEERDVVTILRTVCDDF